MFAPSPEFISLIQGSQLRFVEDGKKICDTQVAALTCRTVWICFRKYFPADLIAQPTVLQVPNVFAECCFGPSLGVRKVTIVLINPCLKWVLGEPYVRLLTPIILSGDLSLIDYSRCKAGTTCWTRSILAIAWSRFWLCGLFGSSQLGLVVSGNY